MCKDLVLSCLVPVRCLGSDWAACAAWVGAELSMRWFKAAVGAGSITPSAVGRKTALAAVEDARTGVGHCRSSQPSEQTYFLSHLKF